MILPLLFLLSVALAHDCIHDDLHHEIVLKPEEYMQQHHLSEKRQVPYQNIRFYLDWTYFPTDDTTMQWISQRVLPDALNFLRQALTVIPVQGKLVLHRRCIRWYTSPYRCIEYQNPTACLNRTIPNQYLAEAGGVGVTNADFILFVDGQGTDGNTLAYATTCQALTSTDATGVQGRPIAGLINFGINQVYDSARGETERVQWVNVAIHEIMHALGFSGSQFPSFLDQNGSPRGSSVQQTFRERGQNITKLLLPKTLAVAQQHFGCPSLNGVELETQGGAGSVGSHFDMRSYLDDVMKGTSTYPRYEAVTQLTLTLFEESGWYQPNYTMAKPMFWGRGLGCRFPLDYCINRTTGVSNFPQNWCTDTSRTYTCMNNRQSRGRCGVAQYSSSLPAIYQYFPGQPTLGGDYAMTDYCPIYEEGFPTLGDFEQTGSCLDPANLNDPNYFGEFFGPSSRCLSSSLLKIPPSGSYYKPIGIGCYGISQCNPTRRNYVVTVGTTSVTCSPQTQISVPTYQGTLTCPVYEEVC